MRSFTRLSALISLSLMLLVLAAAPPVGGGTGTQEDSLITAMKFVKVPKGTYWAGFSQASTKKILREAEVFQDFEMAAHTVTQEQWTQIMGSNPSWFSRTGGGKDLVKDISDADLKRFPVEQVSWDDTQAFLKKLNDREKGKGWLYRLPREYEWEYACRARASAPEDCSFDFYLDKPTNNLSSKDANFNGDLPGGSAEKGPYLARTTKVGSYPPNKLGLFDMHANVWQWCEDLYDSEGMERILRGGAWGIDGRFCGAASRHWMDPTTRDNYNGFRIIRVPSDSK
jgi:formylglycine-generating enzyme required for sulfatase activity